MLFAADMAVFPVQMDHIFSACDAQKMLLSGTDSPTALSDAFQALSVARSRTINVDSLLSIAAPCSKCGDKALVSVQFHQRNMVKTCPFCSDHKHVSWMGTLVDRAALKSRGMGAFFICTHDGCLIPFQSSLHCHAINGVFNQEYVRVISAFSLQDQHTNGVLQFRSVADMRNLIADPSFKIEEELCGCALGKFCAGANYPPGSAGSAQSGGYYHCSATVKRFQAMKKRGCAQCGRVPAPKTCASCKSVFYCDAKCQKLHWKAHKRACRRPLGVRAFLSACHKRCGAKSIFYQCANPLLFDRRVLRVILEFV